MKVNKQNTENSQFAREIMSKIEAIRKYLKVGSLEDIEEYRKKHGTYNGIEDWINCRL